MPLTIALDGPVGAGKSSVAEAVAEKLHMLHLDTGAMYRALGYFALKKGVDPACEKEVIQLLPEAEITVRYTCGKQHTFIGGEDVTDKIRTPEVGMAASAVSRYSPVRDAMVASQQRMAAKQPMLLDGRDIGTRVLPHATLKIFLTASAEERARRRYLELQGKHCPDTYEQVLEDLKRRDAQDTQRKVDPLRPAPNARILDATDLTLEQVVDTLVAWAREVEA